MTNPNNAIGTNGAYSGRTSPNALNDITASYTAGIISGWVCAPSTGMTVTVGGNAGTRDVALAEDNAGNKLTINNRSGGPVAITLGAAPSTNNRIDAIVAYIDNPSTGDGSATDNPTACGLISVQGTVAANPTEPTEAQIRSAITLDGATGGSAYYVVLATVKVGTNVTTIGSGVITQGTAATTTAHGPADAAVQALSDYINLTSFTTVEAKNLNWSNIASPSSLGGSLTFASNAAGTVGKIYGRFSPTPNSSSNNAKFTVQTPFRPDSTITIGQTCIMMSRGDKILRANISFTVSNTGLMKFEIDRSFNGNTVDVVFIACMIYFKDFGDTPEE